MIELPALKETLVYLFLLGLVGCGSDNSTPATPASPPPPAEPPPQADLTLETSLSELGVSQSESPRLSNSGVPLPESYSPYGQRLKVTFLPDGSAVIGSPKELVLGGFNLAGEASSLTLIENFDNDPAAPQDPTILYSIDEPWIIEAGASGSGTGEERVATTLRDVAAADVDGDGLDELVMAYVDADQVFLRVVTPSDTSIPDVNRVVPIPPGILPIGDLRMAAGDFDLDGRAELSIGISGGRVASQNTQSSILILDDKIGDFALLHTEFLESTLEGVFSTLVMEAGNVDYDSASELVVVLNEIGPSNGARAPRRAASQFIIFDDADAGYSSIQTGTLEVSAGPGLDYIAEVADVAIGDLNNDSIGDIVFGGLADLTKTTSCNFSESSGFEKSRYLLVQLEFNGAEFVETAAAFSSTDVDLNNDGRADLDRIYPSGPCNNRLVRFAEVNIVDFDADGLPEIQINQFVLNEIPELGAAWESEKDGEFVYLAFARLPDTAFFPNENANEDTAPPQIFDRNTAALIATDFNGDGREDLVSYRRSSEANPHRVRAFGITDPVITGQSEIVTLATLDVEADFEDSTNPILVSIDSNFSNEGDLQVMEYTGHELVWTEPLILAALAAPPCIENIGQNTDACTTAWGRSQTTGVEGERELKFSAGVTVGLSSSITGGTPVAQTEIAAFEVKTTLTRGAAEIKSEGYEVTKSVSYESGPMEDSVIFSSIPYDVYTYQTILNNYNNNPGDNSLVTQYQIMLPRDPVIRVATVNYFNQHTADGAVKIDDDVFQHVVGHLDSYPTPVEREIILDERRSQLEAIRLDCPGCWQVDPENGTDFDTPLRQFDPFEALPGLKSEKVAVGQGGGVTEVEIEISQSMGNASNLESSAELEVQVTTLQAIAGIGIGGNLAHTTKLSSGEGTTYGGMVGSIGDENFAANQYRFGLFTYLQSDPDGSGQEFQVINYWVEPL